MEVGTWHRLVYQSKRGGSGFFVNAGRQRVELCVPSTLKSVIAKLKRGDVVAVTIELKRGFKHILEIRCLTKVTLRISGSPLKGEAKKTVLIDTDWKAWTVDVKNPDLLTVITTARSDQRVEVEMVCPDPERLEGELLFASALDS